MMLSKIDIEREIGKGINIVPFNRSNIKENSINFTLSNMAWTLNPNKLGYGYERATPACHAKKVIIKANCTTLVYTQEVIALNNCLGGTFHAKVGIVSKGVVFCSTMIGPSYCGHLLISLHNPTNNDIELHVGDTFISLTLYKLKHKINAKHSNTNSGGHIEKTLELGVHLREDQKKALTEDWKKNISTIRNKLKEEIDYKELKESLKKTKVPYYSILVILVLMISSGVYFALHALFLCENVYSALASILVAILTIVIEKSTEKLQEWLNYFFKS